MALAHQNISKPAIGQLQLRLAVWQHFRLCREALVSSSYTTATAAVSHSGCGDVAALFCCTAAHVMLLALTYCYACGVLACVCRSLCRMSRWTAMSAWAASWLTSSLRHAYSWCVLEGPWQQSCSCTCSGCNSASNRWQQCSVWQYPARAHGMQAPHRVQAQQLSCLRPVGRGS